MKKLLISLVVIFILMLSCAYAADFTETAYPASAEVTVNGETVDFCAYNIYGSNYFMLRDVAMALRGTEKQFNILWNNGTISMQALSYDKFSEYEPVGSEFSQKSDTVQDAYFSVPKIKLYDGNSSDKIVNSMTYFTSVNLVGYNIGGNNYFKIRDIARIFDFNVSYEDGSLIIDTSNSYKAELPYEEDNEIIGMAYESDFPLFINEMPLISYYSTCDTAYNDDILKKLNDAPMLNAVYISALDLDNYGFDKTEDGTAIYLTRNKDKQFGIIDGETINSLPSDTDTVYKSDFSVYLNGGEARSILINGKPYIAVCELLKYGGISENIDNNAFADLYDTRINIDFLEYELEAEFDDDLEAITVNADNYEDMNLTGNKGTIYYNRSGSLMKYKTYSGLNSEHYYWYIGGRNDENRLDGYGIEKFSYNNTAGAGVAVRRYSGFLRGVFEGGSLVDGISYSQRHIEYGSGEIPGTRTEGAMINGYKRESEIDSSFRFGYRVICEGTVENGKYCGYYRQYDDTGRLIFEGDYIGYVDGLAQ